MVWLNCRAVSPRLEKAITVDDGFVDYYSQANNRTHQ
jgi:hypothetical protein